MFGINLGDRVELFSGEVTGTVNGFDQNGLIVFVQMDDSALTLEASHKDVNLI